MAQAQYKLPQSRMCLKTAQYGIARLIEDKPEGYAFRLTIFGTLSALRACQASLYGVDRHLTDEHRRIIEAWWKSTGKAMNDIPELAFIKMARDSLLKAAFSAVAVSSHTETGGEILNPNYELAYYNNGERFELLPALESAAAWCDRELTSLEAQLPYPQEPEPEREPWEVE